MSRNRDLLKKAAEALKVGEDPLHISFLSANDVTLDEAYDLAGGMAAAIDFMLSIVELHEGAEVS